MRPRGGGAGGARAPAAAAGRERAGVGGAAGCARTAAEATAGESSASAATPRRPLTASTQPAPPARRPARRRRGVALSRACPTRRRTQPRGRARRARRVPTAPAMPTPRAGANKALRDLCMAAAAAAAAAAPPPSRGVAAPFACVRNCTRAHVTCPRSERALRALVQAREDARSARTAGHARGSTLRSRRVRLPAGWWLSNAAAWPGLA